MEPPTATPTAPLRVVSLGDSYSTGTGPAEPLPGDPGVCGRTVASSVRVAAAAVGAPASAAPAVVEAPGGDSGDLGADLADGLIADVDDGRRGLAVVALEPAADPLEVALVLEHVVEARHPGSTPIGILDVVAVSSVAEIRELLLEPGDADTTPFDAAERLAGRRGTSGPSRARARSRWRRPGC